MSQSIFNDHLDVMTFKDLPGLLGLSVKMADDSWEEMVKDRGNTVILLDRDNAIALAESIRRNANFLNLV